MSKSVPSMQDFFTKAVLAAAPLFSHSVPRNDTGNLRYVQDYYGGRCLRLASWSGLQLTPTAAKALMVLKRMGVRQWVLRSIVERVRAQINS